MCIRDRVINDRVNWRRHSGRRRGCAVHRRRIKWSTSPTLAVDVKSTSLSCISPRRAAAATAAAASPYEYRTSSCSECSSTARHHWPPPLTDDVTPGQSRPSRATDDSDSGRGLLYDETYTSRRTLRQSHSQQQQHHHHHAGRRMSPSRTVLLLGAD